MSSRWSGRRRMLLGEVRVKVWVWEGGSPSIGRRAGPGRGYLKVSGCAHRCVVERPISGRRRGVGAGGGASCGDAA